MYENVVSQYSSPPIFFSCSFSRVSSALRGCILYGDEELLLKLPGLAFENLALAQAAEPYLGRDR
jgi:hypothetical protein